MTQNIANSSDEITVEELIKANEYTEVRDRLGDDDVVFKLAAGRAPDYGEVDNRAYVRVFNIANGYLVYYDSITTCNHEYTETLDFDTFVDWSFDWVSESIDEYDRLELDDAVEVKVDELEFGDEFETLLEKHH